MMQSTFILSLLAASAVSAQQYGSNPKAPIESLPRSTPCSTSVDVTALPSMIYSVELSTSIPVEIQTEIGVDQPAPSALVDIPLSLRFDQEKALAFTSSVAFPTPTYGPPPSTTPCSSTAVPTTAPALTYSTFFSTTIPIEISISIGIDQPAPSASVYVPASESFDSKFAPAFTSSTAFPSPTFELLSSSTPCPSEAVPTPVSKQSTESASKPTITVFPNQPFVPKPKSTSCTKTKSKATITVFPNQPFVPKPTATSVTGTSTSAKSKPTITVFPNQPFVPKPATTLSTKTRSKATITVYPRPTAGVPGAQQPPQSRPSKTPSAGGSYQGAPGYGGGRPRYSAWGAAHRPHASAAAAKASSAPCTLETKSRPSATRAAGGY